MEQHVPQTVANYSAQNEYKLLIVSRYNRQRRGKQTKGSAQMETKRKKPEATLKKNLFTKKASLKQTE
jgi:hypothetical protein